MLWPLASFLSEILAAADILGRAQVQAEQRAALGQEFELNTDPAFAETAVGAKHLFYSPPGRGAGVGQCFAPTFEEFIPEGVTPTGAAEFIASKVAMTKKAFKKLLARNRRQYQDYAFYISNVESIPLIEAAQQGVVRAIKEGLSQSQFNELMQEAYTRLGVTPLDPWHLETVFRTNIQSAYQVGRYQQLADPDVLKALPYWQYRAIMDSRTRPAHAAMNGFIALASDSIWKSWYPPNGYNCFAANTQVEGRFEGGLKTWYSGPMIEIQTRKGYRLTLTPNHPVLTAKGWTRAGKLSEGDNLFSYRIDAQSPVLSNIDDQQNPAAIEDVFESLSRERGFSIMPLLPADLHGDAVRTNGYGHIIMPDGQTSHGMETPLPQLFSKPKIEFAQPSQATLQGFGASQDPFGGIMLSSPLFPGAAALSNDSGTVLLENSPLEQFCFGTAAYWDAMALEEPRQQGTADPQFVRQLLAASAGEITLDDILRVFQFDFSGHVYDLQTPGGWIIANGIVASNCRCTVTAAGRRDAERRAASRNQDLSLPGSARLPLAEGMTARPDPGFEENPIAYFERIMQRPIVPAAGPIIEPIR